MFTYFNVIPVMFLNQRNMYKYMWPNRLQLYGDKSKFLRNIDNCLSII